MVYEGYGSILGGNPLFLETPIGRLTPGGASARRSFMTRSASSRRSFCLDRCRYPSWVMVDDTPGDSQGYKIRGTICLM